MQATVTNSTMIAILYIVISCVAMNVYLVMAIAMLCDGNFQ